MSTLGEPLPRDLLDSGERLTPEDLRGLQLSRLRATLRHAYDNVELYRKKFDAAGVGPDDVHLAEVHDATAFGELSQTENLGFCKPGEGGPFAASGATKLGGRIPINTSGGLESRGHPIGATGLGQITEIVWQLRGECGERQVPDARVAMISNGAGAAFWNDVLLLGKDKP